MHEQSLSGGTCAAPESVRGKWAIVGHRAIEQEPALGGTEEIWICSEVYVIARRIN
jgi:hypothetical protein